MKPYRGIVRISCAGGICDKKLVRPEAGCVNCDAASIEILDLDGKVVAKKIVKREQFKEIKKPLKHKQTNIKQ